MQSSGIRTMQPELGGAAPGTLAGALLRQIGARHSSGRLGERDRRVPVHAISFRPHRAAAVGRRPAGLARDDGDGPRRACPDHELSQDPDGRRATSRPGRRRGDRTRRGRRRARRRTPNWRTPCSPRRRVAQQSAAGRGSGAQPKAAPAHRKAPAVLAAAPHAPLTIAQADPPANDATAATVAPGEAREPDALLDNPLVAKTLDIKDHVVAATRHVVSVIGDMFASVGDSIGGAVSGNRQFNSAS